jgi:tetratricopeptide (TPR) repeat protein
MNMRSLLAALCCLCPLTPASAQPAPSLDLARAFFGRVLKEWNPTSGRLLLRIEFDTEEDLQLFEPKLLSKSGGVIALDGGALTVGAGKPAGGGNAREVLLLLRELQFEKTLTVRAVLDPYDSAKAMAVWLFHSSPDGAAGYRLTLSSGKFSNTSLSRSDPGGGGTTLASKAHELVSGDRLEMTVVCGQQKVAASIKGRKSRSLTLDGKDGTFTAGRCGLKVLAEGKERLRIHSLELEGFVTAASLSRLIDTANQPAGAPTAQADEPEKPAEKPPDAPRPEAPAPPPPPPPPVKRGPWAMALLPLKIDLGDGQKLAKPERLMLARAANSDDPVERTEFAQRVLAMDPELVSGLLILATAELELGEFTKAREHLTRAFQKTPGIESNLLLALLGLLDDDAELLRNHAERAVTTAPNQPLALALRACARLRAGDRKAAGEEAQRAQSAQGAPEWAKLQAGRVAAACRGPKWTKGPFTGRGTRFEVTSEISEAWSAELARRLDQAVALFMGELSGPEPKGTGRVLGFATEAAASAWLRETTLGPEVISSARFVPATGELLAVGPDDARLRAAVLREAFRWYADAVPGGVPPWLGHGLALCFEGTDLTGAAPKTGLPLPAQLELLKTTPPDLEPLRALLSASRGEVMDPGSGRPALAWALCHFLRHGPGTGKDVLAACWAEVKAGKGAAAAQAGSFGAWQEADWTRVVGELRTHLQGLAK